jgi:molybdenum cofactor cytidylyltransferase
MTGTIILAAGESRRLGQPKQNLVFENKTLLERAVGAALGSGCKPVIVVLGANADVINPAVSKDVKPVYNSDWGEGMASSIRAGVNELNKYSNIDSVLIMLCDQPFADVKLISSMQTRQQQTGKAIVACSYGNTIGVPALLNKSLFPELLLLQGNEGAKHIIKDRPQELTIIPFEKGIIDIDTPEDLSRLAGSSD